MEVELLDEFEIRSAAGLQLLLLLPHDLESDRGAAASAETLRLPWPQSPPPAHPPGPQGIPRPAERPSPYGMSWVFLRVSFLYSKLVPGN